MAPSILTKHDSKKRPANTLHFYPPSMFVYVAKSTHSRKLRPLHRSATGAKRPGPTSALGDRALRTHWILVGLTPGRIRLERTRRQSSGPLLGSLLRESRSHTPRTRPMIRRTCRRIEGDNDVLRAVGSG